MLEWSTACPDWESRLREGRSLVPVGPLFPEEAERSMEVFRDLRVVDIPGAPTVGEVARPWLTDFASAFFGSYDPDSGRRLIRTYYFKVPKKNWKSGIAAFVMGTVLIRNWRESGEFGIIAPTTEIANNAFGPLKHAIRKSEELSDILHIQDHIRTITHRTTGASLQVVAAESDTVGGKKFIVTLVEELWLFGKRANAESMLIEATGGMASRDEGAVIYITTESDEAPAGVYKAKNLYARKVRDGEIVDPSFLPVLYEWPTSMVESKACLDLANAWMVNPNLGASVSEEWLRTKYAESKLESDKAFQQFVAKHLNVEIGLALRSDRWIGADYWEAQAQKVTLEDLIARCEIIVSGVDGGGLDDFLGASLIGRERDTGNWLHWARAWADKKVLELRKQEATRLLELEATGDLVLVDKIGDDVEQLVDVLERINDAGLLGRIGVDPAGIGSVVEEITTRGLRKMIEVGEDGESREVDRIVGVSQGWKLNGAIKTLERKLAEGTFLHGGTRLMEYCVGNAKVEPRGNAILITKQASGVGKIDPLMATFSAVTLMSLNPPAMDAAPEIRWA